MEWKEFIYKFDHIYQAGEMLYDALAKKRPENTDIVISPKQIGDTVWLAAYAEAYKEEYKCRVMFVAKNSQLPILKKYSGVDYIFGIDDSEMEAISLYIVRNELWYENHIYYGNHPGLVVLNKENYGISMSIPDYDSIAEERRAVFKLESTAQLSKMDRNILQGEKCGEYENSVMLMPSANTFKTIPLAFWEKLAKHFSDDLGYKVYTNYNGLENEIMIPGTEPFASTLEEISALAESFKLFVGLRSGICDYLAACNANLAVIYSQGWYVKENGEYHFKSDPSLLGNKPIHNYAYENEDELVLSIGRLIDDDLNDENSSKDKEMDVLVVITPKDCERLMPLYSRLVNGIEGGRIKFVGSVGVKEVVSADSELEASTSFIAEDEIIPFDNVHQYLADHMKEILAGRELPRGITGWYYQQFLKMQYARICKDEYYMVWDGDTIPCRNINMFKQETGQPYFDLKHEYHPEYFETMGKVLPGCSKVIEQSFISEHMIINSQIMRDMIAEIESNENLPGNEFWEKIISAIPAEKIQDSSFSEFETYGTYVALRHMGLYKLREWHSFRQGGTFFSVDTITERDFNWLSKDFDAISFEKGHTVREDNKNLFDNPYYQEKLTPRQMLEAAQLEYKEGYKETWGDDNKDVNNHSGMYSGSDGIVIEDRLKYLTPETYKEYEKIGDDLENININQAYLAYENAEYLCADQEARERITAKKQKVFDTGKVSVKKTAIVVLSYNNEYLLQRCIESIYNNCNPESYFLVVFDNGSKDGTADWLASWGENHDEALVILNETNLGFSGGNNAACQYISEDYDVFFLNNDVRVPPNALFWLRMGLYEADDIGGVGAVQNYADADQFQDVTFDRPEKYVEYGASINIPLKNALEEQSKICGFALLIRREAWDMTGFDERFNPGYVEDDDICLNIRSHGYRMMVCHNAFIYHVGSQSFIRVENPHQLFVLHRDIVIEKWGFDSTIFAAMSPNEYAFIQSLAEKGYDENSRFSLVHVGSGCGNMLGHIHYLYPEAEVVGVEENEAARKFAISCISVYPSIESLPKKIEEYDVVAYGLG